jgi:hypothetical protein
MACVALHSTGTFQVTDAGRPVSCTAGERCRCWSSDYNEGTCDDSVQCQSGYVCWAQRCVILTPSSDAGVVHADAGDTGDAGDAGDSGEAGDANDAGDGHRDGVTDAKTRRDGGTPDSGRSNP